MSRLEFSYFATIGVGKIYDLAVALQFVYILTVYDNILHSVPNAENNISKSLLKMTMGPSFIIGAAKKASKEDKEDKKAPKPEIKKGAKEE